MHATSGSEARPYPVCFSITGVARKSTCAVEGAVLQCNTALWTPFQAFYALTLYPVERKGCCDSKDHRQVICCGEFASCCR